MPGVTDPQVQSFTLLTELLELPVSPFLEVSPGREHNI